MHARVPVIVVALAASILPTRAQDVGAPQQQVPVFRGATERVRFDVLAMDGRKPISGLTAEDFEVTDNGIPQKVELSATAGNVAVALALDVSGSMEDNGAMKDLVGGCQAVVNALKPADLAWLVTFSDQFTLRATPASERPDLLRALEGLKARAGTSMWDALFASVSLVNGTAGRSLVLLFTDGQDTTSWLREKPAMDTLQRSDVVVNVVMPRYPSTGFLAMEAATKATGGTLMEAERSDKLARQFVKLLDDFRSGYVLSYSPAGVPRDDGWHDVKIKLKQRKGSVRARPGYFAAIASRR